MHVCLELFPLAVQKLNGNIVFETFEMTYSSLSERIKYIAYNFLLMLHLYCAYDLFTVKWQIHAFNILVFPINYLCVCEKGGQKLKKIYILLCFRRADVSAVVSSRPKSSICMGHMHSLIFCIVADGFPEHHPPLKYISSYLDGDPKAHSSNWKLLQVRKPHRILKRVYPKS